MDLSPRKKVYNYVNCRKKVTHKINNIRSPDGTLTNDNYEISCILNRQFNSVFVDDSSDALPALDNRTDARLSSIDFTISDVLKILCHLDPNKSQGTDLVHPYVLFKCAASLAYPIYLILRASFVTGSIPPQWTEANVTPIFKKGSRLEPVNYRPVSLTSMVCRIMEKIVKNSIMHHLSINNLLSNKQHGFVKK